MISRCFPLQALLKNGHRCVLVCDGFYQFTNLASKRGRQAYFIHLPRLFETRIKREIMQPFYIAALFDRSKQADGRDLYSFTIVVRR